MALAALTTTVGFTADTPMAITMITTIVHASAGPIADPIAAADPAAVHIVPASAIGAMAAATMPGA